MMPAMHKWYYSAGGQQRGPVSLDELRQRAASGQLNPAQDLVWNSTMEGWLPAGQVPGIFDGIGAEAAMTSNPYAPPLSAELSPVPVSGEVREIAAGTQPLDTMACLSRSFTLTNRNFPKLLLIGIVYVLITIAVSFLVNLISGEPLVPQAYPSTPRFNLLYFLLGLANNVFDLFLNLGLTRIALNFVSGEAASLGQLFSQGAKLVRTVLASILFVLMVIPGLILLIVPGIYIALRFGMFLSAIVDRDLGVIDSLKYSYNLTRNSALPIFLLYVMGGLIGLGGLLALGAGLLYAVPVVTLSFSVAYRWLQFGQVALLDIPGTKTPVLRGRTSV